MIRPELFVLVTTHERVNRLAGLPRGLLSHAALAALLESLGRETFADPPALAARFALGLMTARPFVAGNELTAMIALEICLEMNDWGLFADDQQLALAGIRIAAGDLPEKELLTWLRSVARPHYR